MNELVIVGGAVVGVLGMVLLAKNYSKESKQVAEQVDKGVDLAEDVLEFVHQLGYDTKQFSRVLDVVDLAVGYVAQVVDGEDKPKVATEVVDHVIGKLGVVPSENEIKLINIVIDEGIKFIDSK